MHRVHAGCDRLGRGAVGLAAVALLLAACGEAPGEGTAGDAPGGATGDQPGAAGSADDGALAPRCEEVDDLVAEPPPDGEPTGTTAAPLDGGELPGEGTAGGVTRPDPGGLAQEVEAWARQHAADAFAGVWIDHGLGGVAVAFTDDVDAHAEAIRAEVHPGVAVAEAAHTEDELRGLQDRLMANEAGGQQEGAVTSSGVQVMINRTTVGVYAPSDERLAELSAAYGADAICFEIQDPPPAPADGVITLAKVDGWRDGLDGTAFAVLEVAADPETAARAWAENVPDDLTPVDDEPPVTPGRYGELDDVDLDRQVLVVWSSGESGSCPDYLADLSTVDGDVVTVERASAGAGACTDDYNPYRLVLAVDRDRLPPVDELPASLVGVPDGQAVAYPAD
ncbi:hypothetical protein [Egicoccus halophilus]|uniref:Uncharacterized protein n=1 Tax=Egicoccus halophilus TaxID=1670830 RepID=A0A8J3A5R6_9ACTN|nr:hypothetical protein [Egicoccus halophilus]GGI03397.1 hypothetical protein GCM10011354_03830 [Egicoccus halophilus]